MPRPDASAKLAANRPKEGPSKILIGAVVAAVAIIAMVVVVAINSQQQQEQEAEEQMSGAAAPPSALPEGGGIAVHHDRAGEDVPTVDVYEDFQCPWCGVFEQVNNDALVQMAQDGEIRLTFHLMSFLDDNLGNDASTRATNAALCADVTGHFTEYHELVYAAQPAQEGEGWSDEQLSAFADQAGISGADKEEFLTCTEEGRFNQYVQNMQTASDQAGITGTPTVLVDGEQLSQEQMSSAMQDPTVLPQLIADAGQ